MRYGRGTAGEWENDSRFLQISDRSSRGIAAACTDAGVGQGWRAAWKTKSRNPMNARGSPGPLGISINWALPPNLFERRLISFGAEFRGVGLVLWGLTCVSFPALEEV